MPAANPKPWLLKPAASALSRRMLKATSWAHMAVPEERSMAMGTATAPDTAAEIAAADISTPPEWSGSI